MTRAPKHRPAWLVLVAAIMLISAARLGLTGLFVFSDDEPTAATRTALVVSAEDAAAKTVELASQAVRDHHAGLLRLHAGFQVVVALFLLYVAAAVFSLDPNGRWLALLAAWVGVVYHVVNVVFGLTVLRPEIMRVAPDVVAQVATGGAASPAGEVLLPALRALSVALPVMTGLFGLAFSGLILVFFGGRRGRAFYGASSNEGGAA